MNRLPASQHRKRHEKRWQHDEKPLPDLRVQIDARSIGLLKSSRR